MIQNMIIIAPTVRVSSFTLKQISSADLRTDYKCSAETQHSMVPSACSVYYTEHPYVLCEIFGIKEKKLR